MILSDIGPKVLQISKSNDVRTSHRACQLFSPAKFNFIMVFALSRARVFTRTIRKPNLHRFHHSATGRFITINSHGTPVTRPIEVWLGDQGNAYVMLDPEISQAFQTGIMLQDGCSLSQDQELFPLTFNHETRHFSHSRFAPMLVSLELNLVI